MAMKYTRGRRKKNLKVNNIHIHVSRHRHVRDSAQSNGSGGIMENLYFIRTESIKENYMGVYQKCPILQG